MKLNIAQTTLGIIFCSLLIGLAQAAQANECTLSKVAGQYGYTSSGTIVNPPAGVFTAVGSVTLTDTGTLSGEQTTSIAGNVVAETISGVFAVNPDCTGTATVYVYRGTTLARTSGLNLVWDDDQKEARGIVLTAGTAITINIRKMFHREKD